MIGEHKETLTVTMPVTVWDDVKEQLNKARQTPCEWCASTTNILESQEAEIEELKESLRKHNLPSYQEYLKVSTLSGGRE